jgi:hypothetical protein
MKNYNDEHLGFETRVPAEVTDIMQVNSVATDETSGNNDHLLDEHELAMAA